MALVVPSDAPVFAGLKCGHENCNALFADLEECYPHAHERHAGVVLAETCSVRETEDTTGKTELVAVTDDSELSG